MRLYYEDYGIMGARWEERRVVLCCFCGEYACGIRGCFEKRSGIGTGVWVWDACHPCREGRVWA